MKFFCGFKSKNFLVFFIAFVLFYSSNSFAQGLQEGEEKLISKDKKPGWITNIGSDFVVGISGKLSTERDARRDALLDARKQIIDRLGVKLTKIQKQKIYEQTSQWDQNIVATGVEGEIETRAISRALIRVRAKEYYIEKYIKKHFGEIEYFYIAYVQVPFSKQEHDRFLTSTFDQFKTDFNNEYGNLLNPLLNIKQKLLKISYLSQLCENARDLVGMRPDFIANINLWENKLSAQKSTTFSKLQIIPIGQTQTIGADRILPEKIGVKVAYQDQPISGIKITLTQNGKSVTNGITDENGIFEYRYDSPILGTVRFQMLLSINNICNLSPVEFIFKNNPRMLIVIPEVNAKGKSTNRIIQSAVMQWLLEHQFQVTENPQLDNSAVAKLFWGNCDEISQYLSAKNNLLLIGRAFVHDVKPLSLLPGFYQAKATCQLKLIDTVKNSIVWNTSFTQDYTSGNGKNSAGENAINELSKKVLLELEKFFLYPNNF